MRFLSHLDRRRTHRVGRDQRAGPNADATITHPDSDRTSRDVHLHPRSATAATACNAVQFQLVGPALVFGHRPGSGEW
jgi:hypothetical protein